MIDSRKFEYIKKNYGYCASWAVWSEAGSKPKSNVGDLSILYPRKNKTLYSKLKPDVVLPGLNLSRGSIKNHFAILLNVPEIVSSTYLNLRSTITK